MQPDRPQSHSLPRPDPDSAAHCKRVAASLRERIRTAGGALTFGAYMQHVLYAPGLGYYSAGSQKFGPAGDFVTAPEVSPLFGYVVARQAAPVLAASRDADILEFGAGSGALAVAVLRRLETLGSLPRRYRILEVSADLRERQERLLREQLPYLVDRIEWVDDVPDQFSGVVLANEVLDAMPVERFVLHGDGVRQVMVAQGDDGLVLRDAPAPPWLAERVAAIVSDLEPPPAEGYLSELSPGLPNWLGDVAARLDDALVLLFDYGLPRREYYAPERHGGWLRCHFRHHAHNDPLIYPGIQDLTAWVDFTAVAEAAVAHGLDVAAYTTQSQFLLAGGLAEELEDAGAASDAARYELSRQVKLLTLPGEMGEHFKCMALARGDVPVPEALLAVDRSHTL